MEFIFTKPEECNLHMIRKFYANWAPDVRSHFVTMRGVNMTITLMGINDIVATPQDTDPLVLTGMNICPPYRAIRHTLCGPQSMVQWTKHSGKRYHQSLPYAHMLREARVWLNIVMHCLMPRLHYTNSTRDPIYLLYALMTATEVNIRAVLKLAMQKAWVHKGHWYAFGGLITIMCRVASVPKENVDYMTPLFQTHMDITRTKGPDIEFGPTLTTAELHRKD
ncbi:hypothetical protein H5410_051655 [Solanum commersonii]|uniref:Putative plant transposon protein domain-containing protein n=1 Tax=Solanum commersonii TaxID=4109 RepID=A0A9J5X162_SOLCO|nr:hypothetical protein H5410_051655 [Solanum commersonii]